MPTCSDVPQEKMKVSRSVSFNIPTKSKRRPSPYELYGKSQPDLDQWLQSQYDLRKQSVASVSSSQNGSVTLDIEGTHHEENTRCQRIWGIIRLFLVILSLVLAIFDMGTDWWAVRDYITFDGGDLTIAMTFFTSLSTLLFLMELYNGIFALRVLGCGRGDVESVELWREVLSLTLLLMEDFPNTVIMYAAFRWGNCDLYIQIFEDTFIARVSLLAAFISSLWKGLLSLKYCFQVIAKEDYTPWRKKRRRKHSAVLEPDTNKWKFRQSGTHSRSRSRPRPSMSRSVSMTWQDRCFCCSCVRCRPLRLIVNILVCVFTAYVFLAFIRQNINERRPDCVDHRVSEAFSLPNLTMIP